MNSQEKVLVALSGGVDSAVSAALLAEQGFDVETVYVRTWEHEKDVLGDCPGIRDLKDAESVASQLKLPFRLLNLTDFYQNHVVAPMVEGYAAGITPNPDILCNRQMKFGALLDYALSESFSFLATGHYCRRLRGDKGTVELWEGKDKNKDQSYFLSRITPNQLKYAKFPLGEIEKVEVRRKAKNMNLKVADKKDSQGICFLGKVKVPEFLSHFIDDKPGDIITVGGQIVGQHSGLHRFTLGQRKGIGVPSNTDNKNFVVTGKDMSANHLIVAFEDENEQTLWGRKFMIKKISWVSSVTLATKARILAKARYRDPSTSVTFDPIDSDRAIIHFDKPQRALTPGQVLALYDGERLLGGGIYCLQNEGRASLSA